ncbi:MAG: hypothetical protein R3B07_28595 [Polyangiaceae bacterium]
MPLLRELRGLPKSPETAALSRERFTGNDRLKPVEQLEVYRQQLLAALHERRCSKTFRA